MSTLRVHLDHYKSQHRTLGCKILHLIGIPVLVLSIPMFLVNKRRSMALFSLGWVCQFVGHFCFERNKPVLLSEMRNPLTIVAAFIYVWDGWQTIFSGCSLTDEDNAGAPAVSSTVTLYRPKVRKSKLRKQISG